MAKKYTRIFTGGRLLRSSQILRYRHIVTTQLTT